MCFLWQAMILQCAEAESIPRYLLLSQKRAARNIIRNPGSVCGCVFGLEEGSAHIASLQGIPN